jgi:hypothetical protein
VIDYQALILSERVREKEKKKKEEEDRRIEWNGIE